MCVCRLLQEQMEKSLADVQHRLSVKASELQAAHQQMDTLEERIGRSLSLIHHTNMLTTSSIVLFDMLTNVLKSTTMFPFLQVIIISTSKVSGCVCF